jgi:hypothetical protein
MRRLDDKNTNGNMMDGMLVTAYFSNGPSSTKAWADGVGTSGGVGNTSSWILEVGNDNRTDDTDDWRLTNFRTTASMRITMDGAPGNTVFDTDFLGAGTVGYH